MLFYLTALDPCIKIPQARDLQLVRSLDAFELALEGADAQDMAQADPSSVSGSVGWGALFISKAGAYLRNFRALHVFLPLQVQRCVARRAFENAGLELLCKER